MKSKSVITRLCAGVLVALILSGCGRSYMPLNAEEPSVSLEQEDILQSGFGASYTYYDVNRHSLRWFMTEDDLKKVFEEDTLMSEQEFGSEETQQLKTLRYNLEDRQPPLPAGQIQARVELGLFKTDNLFKLSSVAYFYDYDLLWNLDDREADDVYSTILSELEAQYGPPHYHFETDFSDVAPHRAFRKLVYYRTDRWHLGHNMIDLFVEVRAYEDPNHTEPAYYASVYEQYAPFVAGRSDLMYDRVTENSDIFY